MSGGSHDYICFKISEYLTGKMKDKELDVMMHDIEKLTHDLEWADSGDIDDVDYYKTVDEFKKKWFGNRDDRLIEIINDSIHDLKNELIKMIGPVDEQ